MTEIKPKRRWFRFSLRMLLVALTVLCVWFGYKVNSARRQREAIAVVQKARGHVYFDYEMVPLPGHQDLVPISSVPTLSRTMRITFPPVNPNPSPSGPAWLRKLLGDEYFREIYQVSMGGSQWEYTNEAEFSQLASLTELRKLYLTNLKIATGRHAERPMRDSDLFVVENMRELQTLGIQSNDVTDSGMEHLKKLPKLRMLDLRGTRVSLSGVSELKSRCRMRK